MTVHAHVYVDRIRRLEDERRAMQRTISRLTTRAEAAELGERNAAREIERLKREIATLRSK